MQTMLRLVYPPQCITCGALVEQEFLLCGECWKDTPFIAGLVCDTCGVPLPGESSEMVEHCDDCLSIARPWEQGRATLVYRNNAKGLVLSLKHGDRLDLVKPAARWMSETVQPILDPEMLVVPVPSHWLRMLKRRYNQAAVLADELGKILGLDVLPDALIRHRRTEVQEGMGREERFRNMCGAITPHANHGAGLEGRKILLIDDVMTSGATFAAATEACHAAGADQVFVLALARVAKTS